MSRYRWSNWMEEESGTPNGDQTFIGIDEKTDDPSLMQPGYYRAAQNVRVVNGNLGTRGGLTYAPAFNATSFGQIYGRGYYVDPATGTFWLMVGTKSGIWFVSDGNSPKFVNLPSGTVFTGPVDLVACYNIVLLFQGPGITPLYWDGTWTHNFGSLPGPVGGKISIPDAWTGEFISDRIVVPYNIDTIAISDIGSYYSYSDNFNDFNINQGEGDVLMRCMEWYRGSALFFKFKSIYLAQNFSGDLTTMILNRIARGVGLCGRRAAILVGNDFFFVSSGAVYRMNQIFEDTPEVRALPLSEPILQTIKRINWPYASGVVVQNRNDRVYFAVPLDASTRNNALLVWNIVRSAWESIDTFPNSPSLGIDDIVEMPYNGQRRLFAIDYMAGAIYLMEDESNIDILGPSNASTQIYTYFLSRGYAGPSIRSNYRHLKIGLASWSPDYSVNVYSSGVNEKQVVATNVTKPNTVYYGFGVANWNPTNVNNDWGTRDRKDYSVTLPVMLGTNGICLDQKQDYVEGFPIRVPGKYAQIELVNIQGGIELRDVLFESWENQRADKRAV